MAYPPDPRNLGADSNFRRDLIAAGGRPLEGVELLTSDMVRDLIAACRVEPEPSLLRRIMRRIRAARP